VIVPYFYKRIDGVVLEEHYEKELFPDYVEALDYRECDLAQYHPDIIFINSPYDEYNYFTSVHPDYYSLDLIQYTDQLVYIPWFTITELTREDERGWNSMEHFVAKPGVVNADKVLVQSEQMRKAYIEYLTDWAGEDTRGIWEEKISGAGARFIVQETDSIDYTNKVPEEWKRILYPQQSEDGSGQPGKKKKAVVYSISGTGFAEYGDRAVEKLQEVLQTFRGQQDKIAMIWYPNEAIEASLRFSNPALWQAYEEIVNRYKEEGWGIYAKGADKELLTGVGDAYYGDACTLSQAMVVKGKPVMLQNFQI
jgi:hypothetical protein